MYCLTIVQLTAFLVLINVSVLSLIFLGAYYPKIWLDFLYIFNWCLRILSSDITINHILPKKNILTDDLWQSFLLIRNGCYISSYFLWVFLQWTFWLLRPIYIMKFYRVSNKGNLLHSWSILPGQGASLEIFEKGLNLSVKYENTETNKSLSIFSTSISWAS